MMAEITWVQYWPQYNRLLVELDNKNHEAMTFNDVAPEILDACVRDIEMRLRRHEGNICLPNSIDKSWAYSGKGWEFKE